MGIPKITEIYHERYQLDSISAEALRAYQQISEEIVALFPTVQTALDVGCGGGALIRGLRALGVEASGIDGSEHAIAIDPAHISLWDLRTPLDLSSSPPSAFVFDLVTCFDVAEHIEQEYAEVLVRTVQSAMSPNSILLFGAAPPGQDGLQHVNCQPPEYWRGLFSPDLVWDEALSNRLRQRIRERPHTNFIWWVEKNLMVLTHAN